MGPFDTKEAAATESAQSEVDFLERRIGQLSAVNTKRLFERVMRLSADVEREVLHRPDPVAVTAGLNSYGGPSNAGTASNSSRLTLHNIDDAFRYQPWGPDETDRGNQVRDALVAAAKVILRVVPESASRTRAINNLMDARMLANQSISFRGWL
jgi:hypothetical protein